MVADYIPIYRQNIITQERYISFQNGLKNVRKAIMKGKAFVKGEAYETHSIETPSIISVYHDMVGYFYDERLRRERTKGSQTLRIAP
jgi:hypothetical protein